MDPPETTFYDIPTDVLAHVFEYIPSASIIEMEKLADVQNSNIWELSGLSTNVIAARATVESFINYKFLPREYRGINWMRLAKRMRLALSKILKTTKEEQLDEVRNMMTKKLTAKNAHLLTPFLEIFFEEVPTPVAVRYLSLVHPVTAFEVIVDTKHDELYKAAHERYDNNSKISRWKYRRVVSITRDPDIYIPLIEKALNEPQFSLFYLTSIVRDAKYSEVVSYILDIPAVAQEFTDVGLTLSLTHIIERNQGS